MIEKIAPLSETSPELAKQLLKNESVRNELIADLVATKTPLYFYTDFVDTRIGKVTILCEGHIFIYFCSFYMRILKHLANGKRTCMVVECAENYSAILTHYANDTKINPKELKLTFE